MDEQRSHAATVEINRGMKGEYSVRVVARHDDPKIALARAVSQLEIAERMLGIHSHWHGPDAAQVVEDIEGVTPPLRLITEEG